MKGETPQEIAYFASFMRNKAVKVPIDDIEAIDMCGTGGDEIGTINISTLASFVVAASGVPVAKHGNRAVSSRAGSADLLESIGMRIDLKPDEVADSIKKFNFGFIFAPLYHPAMKSVMPVRKELGVRTIFNILGPLCNPALVKKQLLGVFSPALLKLIPEALRNLGSQRAFVVHGEDGLDEASVSSRTYVAEVSPDGIKRYEIAPEDFGIKRTSLDIVKISSPNEAKEACFSILSGEEKGPRRDIVALNAAFGLVLGGAEKSLKDAYYSSVEVLKSGKVLKLVEKLVDTDTKLL
jgi:anthranilate phosphoribosyltransferase